MYENIKISKSQAREIAYDLYDIIVQGIKEMEENKSIQDALTWLPGLIPGATLTQSRISSRRRTRAINT